MELQQRLLLVLEPTHTHTYPPLPSMNLPDEIFTNANHDLDQALAEVMDLTNDGIDNKKLVTCIKDLVELRYQRVPQHTLFQCTDSIKQDRPFAFNPRQESEYCTRRTQVFDTRKMDMDTVGAFDTVHCDHLRCQICFDPNLSLSRLRASRTSPLYQYAVSRGCHGV